MPAISSELITMSASALGGFLMKQIAEARKERHAEHMRAIEKVHALEASRERAAGVAGKWIRRLLVVAIVFAVIVAPFLTAVLTDAPTVVQYTEPKGGFLWGLFGSTRERIRFATVDGYLLTPETRQALLAIIAFYFGQGAAK
mgnify:CR=1 FL=1